MKKGPRTFPLGRDPKNGEFVKVSQAKRQPNKYIIESVPKKGYGDTKKK